VQINPTELAPIIQQAVDAALARFESERAKLDDGSGKLCYSEQEAARLLGVEVHVLRDERLRGRIEASQIMGRRIRYTRENLTDYLAARRWSAGGGA
jgi:hypothetical protein